ncbi:uncharacterized protein LOC124483613 [Hypomesus transpacificus]|uniref:uncharacterized protein LOC124483613 n=1 Tax=Hypomesus transpacificus TaxID=137520 RepID=UPI001F07A9B7|nr:uncharacterized protein LOC124483613 [Hypomesus transpacificus]
MNVREANYYPRRTMNDARYYNTYINYGAGDYTSRDWTGGGWEDRDSIDTSFSTDSYMVQKGGRENEIEPLKDGDPQKDGSSSLTADTDMDVDGQPVELNDDDQELSRKKKELQLIEEQIILKKASIAMKQVAPILKAMEVEELNKRKFAEEVEDDLTQQKTQSGSKLQTQYVKDAPFRDRVNGILLNRKNTRESPAKASAQPMKGSPQQPRALFQPPTMAKSFVERMNASILKKDGYLKKSPPKQKEEEHPLKHRVKDLMERRCHPGFAPPSNQKVLEVECDRPIQNPVDPDPEQDPASKGFQCFLNILNRGVDIDRLAKIVNDIPCEETELGHLQPEGSGEGSHGGAPPRQGSHSRAPPQQGSHGGAPPRQGSHSRAPPQQGSHGGAPPRQGSHGGAPPQDHSCSTSGERTVGTAADNHTLSLLREKSPTRDQTTGRRSEPLPAEVKKDVNPEDERKYGQMHDLLQTIGLDLGAAEVGQLSDRIQERLYGKNGHTETKRGRREDERKRKQRDKQREREHLPKRHHSSLSSDSTSPSPLPHRRSPRKASRDSGEVHPAARDGDSRDKDQDGCLDNSMGQSIPTLTRSFPSHPMPYPAPAPVDMTSTYTPPQQPQYMAQHLSHHPNTIPPAWGYTPSPDVYLPYAPPYPHHHPNPPYYFDGSLAAFSHTQVCYPPPGYLPPPDASSVQGPCHAHWSVTRQPHGW